MKRTIKRMLFLTMTLTALMLCCLFSFTASAEENFSTAKTISVNKSYSDNISDWDDVDYFKFTLTSPGKVVINFKRENLFDSAYYWCVSLYDKNAKFVDESFFTGSYTESNSCEVGLSAGTYFLRIDNNDELSDVTYTFNVKFSKSNYWEKENNETFQTATQMTLNKKYYGSICVDEDDDFYKIVIPNDGKIYLNFERENLFDSSWYWKITLYNKNSEYITARYYRGSYTKSESCEIGLAAGTYYLKITRDDEFSSKTYGLTVKYTKTDLFEKENNETFKTATPIVLNKEYGGSICEADDDDYYKFTLLNDTKVAFKFNEYISADVDEDYEIKIFDYNTNEMSSMYVSSKDTSKKQEILLPAGTYYIEIKDYDDYSLETYTFSVSIGATSKITSTKTTSSVTLKWNKVTGASGYRVFQKVDGKWKTLTDTSKLTYTIKNLKAGTKYTFAVRAYILDGKTKVMSPKYKTISVTTADALGVTSKLTATQTTSSVTLKWNKVAGATGYRVYRMKKGEWVKLADTTKLTYTEKRLGSGSMFKYRVKAYTTKNGKTVWATKYKQIETSTKPATSTLKATSTAKGKATLTWSNPSGESGFEIYYSTKKDSGFKKIATTKANVKKATVSKLQSKKTYYFKVRSYKKTASGNVYSAYSAVKSVKVK